MSYKLSNFKKNNMKKILTVTLLSIISIITNAQTVVNREWTQLAGVPDPLSITTSCIDYQNNIITASSSVVTGQDANILVVKYDQDGNTLWQNTFNGISNGKDYSTSVKTDSTGNVFVIGTTFNTASNYDFILIKYNSQGVLQWQQIYNGAGNNIDFPTAIIFDNSSNIYITGASTGTNSLTDYATIKYSSAGVQQWVSTYDFALGYEAPVGIDINPVTNNIYITGASASTQASNNWDYATVEYNSSGSQLNVSRVVSAGNGLDKPTAISRDNSGNIYITGSSYNSVNNSYDIKTIKLNSSLILQWSMTFNGDNLDDQANSIDVDPSGNVLIAGYVNRSATGENIIILKYSPTGTLLWQKEINEAGSVADERGNRIIVDTNGNAYVAGSYNQNGNKNFISMKIAPDGTVNWQDIFDGAGSGDDEATSIDINNNGDIVVSGSTDNGANNINTTISYEGITINPNNIGTTSDSVKFLKNEVIIKFDPNIINPTFSENRDLHFAYINEVLPDSTVTKIGQAIGIENPNELILVKVYNWMTPSDSISVARNGEHIVMDKIWSTYRMLLPNNLDELSSMTALGANVSEMEYAELNAIFHHHAVPNDLLLNQQACLVQNANFTNQDVRAEQGWDVEVGRPFVRVGVIDGGAIDFQHPDFGNGTYNASKLIGEDFTNANAPIQFLNNFGWHATACGGIIGAIRNDGTGIAGIAGGDEANNNLGVLLVSLATDLTLSQVSDAIAKGSSNTYNGGFGYFCDVLSNSWGATRGHCEDCWKPTEFATLEQSVKLSFDNHCVFVASRGNHYTDNSLNTPIGISNVTEGMYPACYKNEWVLNVGASGNNGQHKTTTNGDIGPNLNLGGYFEAMYSKGVDVIAPGSSDLVLTTKPTNAFHPWEYIPDDNYTWFNGSSASAPHVAGLAALMLSHHAFGNYPNMLDDGDIQHLIRKYANDIGSEGQNLVGSGKIDLQNTLNHIDLNQGYWVMHSQQANSSYSGQLFNLGQQTIDFQAPDGPVTPGIYLADLIQNVYTHTIPLPQFTTNPQILDKWITHSGGVSNSGLVDGTYNAQITTSINNGNIIATYITHTWYIHTAIQGSITPFMFPVATNSLNPNFSMLMYDPSIVTKTSDYKKNNRKYTIYPNPSNSEFNVSFHSNENGNVTFKIYNFLGQLIMEENQNVKAGSNTYKFSTSTYAQGLYNIVISDDNSSFSSNILVQH